MMIVKTFRHRTLHKEGHDSYCRSDEDYNHNAEWSVNERREIESTESGGSLFERYFNVHLQSLWSRTN